MVSGDRPILKCNRERDKFRKTEASELKYAQFSLLFDFPVFSWFCVGVLLLLLFSELNCSINKYFGLLENNMRILFLENVIKPVESKITASDMQVTVIGNGQYAAGNILRLRCLSSYSQAILNTTEPNTYCFILLLICKQI